MENTAKFLHTKTGRFLKTLGKTALILLVINQGVAFKEGQQSGGSRSSINEDPRHFKECLELKPNRRVKCLHLEEIRA